jgi:hypothetical protein
MVMYVEFSRLPDRNILAVTYENVCYYDRSGDKNHQLRVISLDEDAAKAWRFNHVSRRDGTDERQRPEA